PCGRSGDGTAVTGLCPRVPNPVELRDHPTRPGGIGLRGFVSQNPTTPTGARTMTSTTPRLTNAEAITLDRVAEFELFNEGPASLSDVAHDDQDAAALVGLLQKGLIDLDASYACLTDAGIERFEAMVANERGCGRQNPFYDHGYDTAA